MKYTKEITDKMTAMYLGTEGTPGKSAKEIAETLSRSDCLKLMEEKGMSELEASPLTHVPERSIIAKLASLGVYKKKGYLTKRGETPVKKEEYIERIAALLDVQAEFLESLEKVNKGVLALIATKLTLSE